MSSNILPKYIGYFLSVSVVLLLVSSQETTFYLSIIHIRGPGMLFLAPTCQTNAEHFDVSMTPVMPVQAKVTRSKTFQNCNRIHNH